MPSVPICRHEPGSCLLQVFSHSWEISVGQPPTSTSANFICSTSWPFCIGHGIQKSQPPFHPGAHGHTPVSTSMEYDWHCRQNFGLVNLNLHPSPSYLIPVTRGSLGLLIYHCVLLYSPRRVYSLLFIEFFFLPLCGMWHGDVLFATHPLKCKRKTTTNCGSSQFLVTDKIISAPALYPQIIVYPEYFKWHPRYHRAYVGKHLNHEHESGQRPPLHNTL